MRTTLKKHYVGNLADMLSNSNCEAKKNEIDGAARLVKSPYRARELRLLYSYAT